MINPTRRDLDPSGKNSCRLGRGGTLYIRGEYVAAKYNEYEKRIAELEAALKIHKMPEMGSGKYTAPPPEEERGII